MGFAAVDALARARILSTTENMEGDLAWKRVTFSPAVELLDDNVAGILGKAQSDTNVSL